jgi:uncharacterized RDD family membrane protein YckC
MQQDAGTIRHASVARRAVAVLIDAFISLAWVLPLTEVDRRPGFVRFSLGSGRATAAWAIAVIYYIALEAVFGVTIGKLLTGIRVVREDGGPIGLGAATIRTVARVVDAFPYFVPYLLGAILVRSSPAGQRLGDRFARTIVIETASKGPAAPAPWVGATEQVEGPPMPPPPPPPTSDE